MPRSLLAVTDRNEMWQFWWHPVACGNPSHAPGDPRQRVPLRPAEQVQGTGPRWGGLHIQGALAHLVVGDAKRMRGSHRDQPVPGGRQVHSILRPHLWRLELTNTPEVKSVGAVRSGDAPQVGVVDSGTPPQWLQEERESWVKARREEHVASRRPQSRHASLDLSREVVRVGLRTHEVIAPNEDRNQIGSQVNRPGNLLLDHVSHPPTTHPQVGVAERRRPQFGIPVKDPREAIGPAEPRVSRGGGVAEALGDRVTEGDKSMPVVGHDTSVDAGEATHHRRDRLGTHCQPRVLRLYTAARTQRTLIGLSHVWKS